MERGRRYGDAADLHRLEHGVGVEGAGAPHVDANLFQLGDLHLGGELAGDRPARLAAPDAPELRVQPQRVDLHHHPVGAVVERVQQLLESRDLAVGRAQVGDLFVVRLDREAPRPELLEQLVLRGDRELLARRLDVERYASPRTSIRLGQPLPLSRSGMSTTVRRFAVTSSPSTPLPRVAPVTSTPSSYVRLTAAPSIFTSSVYPAERTSGSSRAFRSSHSASSTSVKALASDSMGTRWRCFRNCCAGSAPTRWVGLSGVRRSGCLASSSCSSRNRRSYSASDNSGLSRT